MRRLLTAFVLLLGCSAESPPLSENHDTSRPGAPIVGFLPSGEGRLADGRVFRFSPAGFDDKLRDAVTADSSGPFELFENGTSAKCFARADGVLRCFGSARAGGLAGAQATDTCWFSRWLTGEHVDYPCANDPVEVPFVPRVKQLSQSCALSVEGAVLCWGTVQGKTSPPTVIAGLGRDIVTVASSIEQRWICGLRNDGRAFCADRDVDVPTATEVPDAGHLVEISLGLGAGCFLDGAGVARCFDLLTAATEPWSAARLDTELRFSRLSIGWRGGCGVTFDRKVACFGSGFTRGPDASPRIVEGLDDITDVYARAGDVMALRDDGSVLHVLPSSSKPTVTVLAP